MEYLLIAILTAAVIFLAAKLSMIKKQIRQVTNQLDDYENKLISIELGDKSMEEMTIKINSMIDDIEQIKVKEAKGAAVLRDSIADISHDMRTPLTSVMGYLQLAKKETLNAQVETYVDIALERTAYCNTLINDFYELSLIDSQDNMPEIEAIDVAGLLCELILANYPAFNEKSIAPHFDGADKVTYAFADKTMLTRVFQNLISNAIKYTNGDINFNISAKEVVTISISNPAKEEYIDTDHIFDKFFMQDKARNVGGSGLGLYISKQLVEAMGGTIEAVFENQVLRIDLVIKA